MNDGAIVTREQDVLRWALEREIVAPIDDPHDFYRHPHTVIWSAVLDVRAAGKTVDYLTIRAELERRGHTEAVGAGYLLDLARDSVRPSDAAVVTAAEEIKQAARTRRLRNLLARHATADAIDPAAVSAELTTFSSHNQPTAPPLLDDVAVLSAPAAEFQIANSIPDRGIVAIVGPPAVGKTFLALGAGLAIAADGQWHGMPVLRPGPVIYIAAEGAPGPRIGAWKIAHSYDIEKPLGLHTWSGAVNLLDPMAVAAFVAAVKPLKPVAVFWDTFARCFIGGDENSAKDVGIAVTGLDRVKVELSATQIVLHHMNKGNTSERGSGALRGACDTVLYLQQADDLLQLTCDKQKDAEPFEPINLKRVPAYPGAGSCVLRLASEVVSDEELTDAQGRALHVLRELFDDERGATAGEWETAIPAMPRATYYRARKVLIDRGYVRAVDEGKTTRFKTTGKRAVSRSLTAVSSRSESESRDVSAVYQ